MRSRGGSGVPAGAGTCAGDGEEGAAGVAKGGGSKTRHKIGGIQEDLDTRARGLFLTRWPPPSLLMGKGKKIGSCSYTLAFGRLSTLLIQAL